MDASRFDHLSKSLTQGGSRRQLVAALTGAAAIGGPAALGHQSASAAPGRGKRRGAHAEHWKHRKATYCLNGETIRRLRRKQNKLLAAGATIGACSPTPPCVPATCATLGHVCGAASDGCGGTLQCGACDGDLTCCAGQCVNTQTDENNCGTCGTVCDVGRDFFCGRGVCIQPT